jgi:hypothetical protein
MKPRTCTGCGQEFERSNGNQKRCDDCRQGKAPAEGEPVTGSTAGLDYQAAAEAAMTEEIEGQVVPYAREAALAMASKPYSWERERKARSRATKIRTNTRERVRLITEGLEDGDWRELGYDSPAAWYAELTDYMLAPAEIRRRLAAALRAEGWSLRGIATELDVSKTTVERDLEVSHSGTPEKVTGADGKSYPAVQPQVSHAQDGQEDGPADDEDQAGEPVTVLDQAGLHGGQPGGEPVDLGAVVNEAIADEAIAEEAAQAAGDEDETEWEALGYSSEAELEAMNAAYHAGYAGRRPAGTTDRERDWGWERGWDWERLWDAYHGGALEAARELARLTAGELDADAVIDLIREWKPELIAELINRLNAEYAEPAHAG